MSTIDDITFDKTIFSQVHHLVLLLYQVNEVALVIPLSNAHLLKFIQSFDDILRCQNYINTNDNKTFTLFGYSGNIETWLWNHHIIPDHLDEIIMFCPNAIDREYFRRWARRYTHKVKDFILYDELDRESLIFGMKYVNNLHTYFQHDETILNLLREDHRKMTLALMDCLAKEINKQDNYIKAGVETTS